MLLVHADIRYTHEEEGEEEEGGQRRLGVTPLCLLTAKDGPRSRG